MLEPEVKIHNNFARNSLRGSKRWLLIVLVFLAYIYWPRSDDNSTVSKSGKTTNLDIDMHTDSDSEVKLLNNHKKINNEGISVSNGWFKGLKAPTCEEYTSYASRQHAPFSKGPLKLPFMRPSLECRTFKSPAVEKIINEFKIKMKDDDLFRIFENSLPNTLDTTILWFEENDTDGKPKTFISTGDIHAEWLRDSARQLSVYQKFIKDDPKLGKLIKGTIIQQAKYIRIAPYCNAFQPPKKSKVSRKPSSIDNVTPTPPWDDVFECKWELDSLASFLTLSNEYIFNSNDYSLFNDNDFIDALKTIVKILRRESSPTFDENGRVLPFYYSFRRETNIGSETLSLSGTGNPVNFETGLIRSAFRPSDDACIFQFLIPSNIQMMIELKKIIPLLKKYNDPLIMDENLSSVFHKFVIDINQGIENHAIVDHKIYGKVYAYEVDGYGGANFMDDANIPSLLSLPDLGYGNMHDEIYQNTRSMILSKIGNPYYLKGKYLQGIGGPHVGLFHAWPMSLLIQIRTTDDDDEILKLLDMIKTTTGGLGLMHEGVNVNSLNGMTFTRPWFSWCNSEFGKTILDLANRKPWLIFDEDKTDIETDILKNGHLTEEYLDELELELE